MELSGQTFYRWQKLHSRFDSLEIRRLKQLEERNSRLKRIVADITLDKQLLQDVLSKKL